MGMEIEQRTTSIETVSENLEWRTSRIFCIVNFGFQVSMADPRVYIYLKDGVMITLGIYADDCIIASNSDAVTKDFHDKLASKYRIKDLGLLEWFLGVKVSYEEGCVRLEQSGYINAMLERFVMLECSIVDTPMDTGQKFMKDSCPVSDEEKEQIKNVQYRRLIGKLIYLAVAKRPDISYAVSVMSKFLSNPGRVHWTAAKRILRYLKETMHEGPTFWANPQEKDLRIECYADDKDTRRSTTGYTTFLNGAIVS